MSQEKVSIIVLAHNATEYCKITLDSLAKTKGVSYEVIVVDNDSDLKTKALLLWKRIVGKINKLLLLNENTLFSRGNNIGFTKVAKEATHVLLLNSDICVKDPYWLRKLLELNKYGIAAYGLVDDPKLLRVDGYCFLIQRNLYDKFKLDEQFKWSWGITKLQDQVLKEGLSVIGVRNHKHIIIHYGSKSDRSKLRADPSCFQRPDTTEWLKDPQIKVIDRID